MADDAQVSDLDLARPILASRLIHRGYVWDLRADDVDLGPGGVVTREYVAHPGAVVIIAIDDVGRVLLQRQYRHPVRAELWEPPAGLLDQAGEAPLAAAQRELAEEADLRAADWRHLLEYYTSPGGLDERLIVFLARGLSQVPESERFSREAEEIGMPAAWIDLDRAADLVLAGALASTSAVAGILAAARAAAAPGGFDALAPA